MGMYLLICLVCFIIIILIISIIKQNNKIENFSNKSDIYYVFWTGGYDSTFRICQLLIDKKKIVQPIYVSARIDNIKGKKSQRHSLFNEYNAMKKITKNINTKFPYTKKTFLPIIDIKNVRIDSEI